MNPLFPLRNLVLATVLTFSPFAAQAASIGGSNGGGGNTQTSTRADLEEIVANIQRHIWSVSDTYLFGREIRITKQALKPELRRLTLAINGADFFTIPKELSDYVSKLKFQIADGDCLDGGQPTDSSTLFQKNAPICLSAPRFSRFPKSALKKAILPLIFHEVAHQFGFNEAQANAYQALADLNLKYRTIYLASLRSRVQCAFASNMELSSAEQQEINDIAGPGWNMPKPWPKLPAAEKTNVLMQCVARAISAGENLEDIYNGSLWQKQTPKTLTDEQLRILLDFQGYKEFSFLTMIKGLTGPGTQSDCTPCRVGGVDQAYVMSVAAKAAIEHIDIEVGREQNKISSK